MFDVSQDFHEQVDRYITDGIMRIVKEKHIEMNENIIYSSIGIVAGSALFSLCRIIVGTKIDNINQYVFALFPMFWIGKYKYIAVQKYGFCDKVDERKCGFYAVFIMYTNRGLIYG